MEATLYAICLDWPGKELVLKDTLPESGAVITMLGCSDSIQWRIQGADLHITVPQLIIDKLPCLHAWTFRIPGAARGIKSPAAI